MRILKHMLFFIVLLVATAGCERHESATPPMRYGSAIVVASAGNDRAESPVIENFSQSPDEAAEGYGGGLQLQQGAIEIQYQFVGQSNYWIPDTDPQQTTEADIYLFRIRDASGQVTNQTVAFTGQPLVVRADDGLELEIMPGR